MIEDVSRGVDFAGVTIVLDLLGAEEQMAVFDLGRHSRGAGQKHDVVVHGLGLERQVPFTDTERLAWNGGGCFLGWGGDRLRE